MLGPDDPLPRRPVRVTVAGVSGSGKTTLCRRLAGLLDLPYVEIDSLYHGPGWQPLPAFVDEVERFTAGERWVIEWQYRAVKPLIAERADLLVWLDPPTVVTLAQLIRRTIRRRIRREELWNDNYEGPLWQVLTDPDHIIRWGIRTRNKLREEVPGLARDRPDLPIVRLRSHRGVDRWLRRLAIDRS
ncbi:AAA family ATPase [Ammonicoccus fulvus]|uniref:AAA family ATPase n=1 Tax=Ammonicoccus fulvus TaxID=3138240 RepID=A0ABZ3FSH8_9ACTN